jgi:SP family facilitated glucose transporter-like MFS transporter 8
MVHVSFGFIFGWLAPAMEYFKSGEAPFEVSTEELSWIATAYFVTEGVFSVLNGLFTRRIGRKPMLVFAVFIQAVGWFVKIIASSPSMIIVGRGLLGIAAGTHDVVWCMYLGEVATPVERGIYGSYLMSLFLGGILLEFFFSLWVPYVYLSIIPFVISASAFLIKLFIKETPFHLVKQGKLDKAIRNLAWLRGKDDTRLVQAEFDEIKKYVEEETSENHSITRVLQNPSQYKVAIVGVLIFTLAQPSGNIAILSFQTILLDLYDDSKPGADLTLVYGLLQFIFINFAPFLIEKIGRKKPMIFGFVATAIIHVALAYFLYIGERQRDSIPYLSYILCGLFNLYGVIFVLTIFPTVYVLKCELFPQEVKSMANCLATMTNAWVDFVVVKLFVWIWSSFGLYVNFLLYAAICILSVVYVYVLIPETRGKTLVEIQEKIKMNNAKKGNNVVSER